MKLATATRDAVLADYTAGEPIANITANHRVSRATVYRITKAAIDAGLPERKRGPNKRPPTLCACGTPTTSKTRTCRPCYLTTVRRKAPTDMTRNSPQIRWAALVPDDVDTEWMDRGLCWRVGTPENWFPSSAGSPDEAEAIATCFQCDVREECLNYALKLEHTSDGEPISAAHRHGIFGGLTGVERGRIALPETDPATHCRNRHELTEETTRVDARGLVECVLCTRDRQNKRMPCPDCGSVMAKGSIWLHRKRRHSRVA